MGHPDAPPTPPPRVICLGLSALDEIWCVETLFDLGAQKIRAADHRQVGGGIAATAAVAVARLGGFAVFWGRAGDDPAGRLMRERLEQEGVDTGNFRLFAEGRSSVSCVIVDAAGERQIANFRGYFPADPEWLPLATVVGASVVLADPRWVEGAVALFRAARSAGIPTVLDGEVAPRADLASILPYTDHAIFSEPGLAGFAAGDVETALEQVFSYGCRVAAVTRGGAGIEWRDAVGLHRHPAFAVDVVDTTGAGDVFHGAYAVAIGGGAPASDAFTFAAAVAALKCTRPDGRSGIPSLSEALEFIRINRCSP